MQTLLGEEGHYPVHSRRGMERQRWIMFPSRALYPHSERTHTVPADLCVSCTGLWALEGRERGSHLSIHSSVLSLEQMHNREMIMDLTKLLGHQEALQLTEQPLNSNSILGQVTNFPGTSDPIYMKSG